MEHADSLLVLQNPKDVQPFIEEVAAAADKAREALGFFPRSVYYDFARRGQLFVAVRQVAGATSFAGYLLFDCRYPRASVLQMYCSPEQRNTGVASSLLAALQVELTRGGFLAIYARVAEDLEAANSFWGRQSFYVQRVELGGASRNRTILVRVHELKTPQLFDDSGLNQFNPLGLPGARSAEPPLFLLDLNVLYDVGQRRPRHQYVAALYQAERMNFCRLAISTEAREELKRTATPGRTDPMQDFITLFPTFPLATGVDELVDELRGLVFPEKSTLSLNDKSDLRHIATVVQNKLDGFVSNDEALLAAAPAIHARFGIRLISTYVIGQSSAEHPPSLAVVSDSGEPQIELRQILQEHEAGVHALLAGLGIAGSAIAGAWSSSGSSGAVLQRFGVWDAEGLIGYLSWPTWTPAGIVSAHIAVSERAKNAQHACRALLTLLLERVAVSGPKQIYLSFPAAQSLVKELAFGLGFSGDPSSSALLKLLDGHVWHADNWGARRADLADRTGLRFPEQPLRFLKIDQHVQLLTPDGNRVHMSLGEIETLLSPVLFCMSDRPAVITPIRRQFSEPLLGHSAQSSLLPITNFATHSRKHFVSSSKAFKHFERGTLVFFYESGKDGGRSALVALAKVQRAYLKEMEQLNEGDLEPSVLSSRTVANVGAAPLKTVTVFDSVFPLPVPVSLKELQALGCGRPNDLITTKPLTSYQADQIVRKAFPQ